MAKDRDKYSKQVKLQILAERRAKGDSWEDAAHAVGLSSESSARSLRDRNPEMWMEAYHEAIKNVVQEEYEPAALEFLREKIEEARKNPDDPDKQQIGQKSAHSILNLSQKLRKKQIEISAKRQHSREADDELIAQAREHSQEIAVSSIEESESDVSGAALPSGEG